METEIEKPYVIGLDMGGTNSVFGIVDQRGTIKSQTVISTRAYPDFDDYVKASVEALQPALDSVGGIENVPGYGITMGLKTITEARNIILLAYGEEKSAAVYQMVYGKTMTYLPASFLQIPL